MAAYSTKLRLGMKTGGPKIRGKSIHEPSEAGDELRLLVTRFRPRGIPRR